jgi:hypothetical protein
MLRDRIPSAEAVCHRRWILSLFTHELADYEPGGVSPR